jgi:hypothetical protein
MRTKKAFVIAALFSGGFAANGCVPDDWTCRGYFFWDQHCFPPDDENECLRPAISGEEVYNSKECRNMREDFAKEDAGADATFESDAQSATTMKHCVDLSPNWFASPQPVWFGPANEAPTACPPEMGAFGSREFFDLHIPTNDGCPECGCNAIEGSCSTALRSIQFLANACTGEPGQSTDFGPVENWDGSCSNDTVIEEGAECPPGSGNLCAQSMYWPRLPEPVQVCKPIEIPVIKAITDRAEFKQVALSCSVLNMLPSHSHDPNITDRDYIPSHTCIPGADQWRSCVRATDKGIYDCDMESVYTKRIITYPENAIVDTRSCTACGCKASEGMCYADLSFYTDDACTELLKFETIGSLDQYCAPVTPPGRRIGSKKLEDPEYIPGSCEPTGGLPIGGIELDPQNAVTWCCLAKEPEPTSVP